MLAPFALVRVAGLAHAAVADLTPPRVRALVGAVVAATSEMEDVRVAAEDALFAVAATDDQLVRRDALALRRDVHNRRVTRVAGGGSVMARLDDAAASVVRRWLAANASLGDASRQLEVEDSSAVCASTCDRGCGRRSRRHAFSARSRSHHPS